VEPLSLAREGETALSPQRSKNARRQATAPTAAPTPPVPTTRIRIARFKRALRAKRRSKLARLTECVATCYESHALRNEEPLRLAVGRDARRGPVAPADRVDELDRGIIEALQENGRESFRSIATRLGVSEATVRARYARLTRDGILQVVGVTNPLGLGFEQALVGIKTSGAPDSVADELARWPEADYVVVTAGQFDLVVEVVTSDRRHLLELTNRMRALAGVVSTETFFYLEMWKQLYDWGTGARSTERDQAGGRT
jgi:Lrp/AsnC family transcriptional regulator for asnA, asnC and gidA